MADLRPEQATVHRMGRTALGRHVYGLRPASAASLAGLILLVLSLQSALVQQPPP